MTRINKWVAKIVVAALASVEAFFISKIDSRVVREGLRKLMNPLKSMALALGDDDPRNAEQVEEIWKTFANQELPGFAETEIDEALQKIEDEHVRIVLNTLAVPVVNMLRIVTDADPNNSEQLRLLVKDFVNDPGVQQIAVEHILVALIEAKIEDPTLREFLLSIIRDGLLEKG